MSVPNESPVNTYTGNGTTTKFPVTFQFETQNTLVLKVDGSVAPISDYYWTSDSSFNFYTAPPSGSVIEITRSTPKERDNDYDDNYNTFRPKTLNKDFDRLWRVIQEYLIKIDRNSAGLAQEIIDRIQADEDMLDYIMNQDNAIKQDYIQRDEVLKNDYTEKYDFLNQDYISRDAVLKNYIDQMIALITGDPSFNGIDAQFVKDESGKTQQEVNNDLRTIDGVQHLQFNNELNKDGSSSTVQKFIDVLANKKSIAEPSDHYRPIDEVVFDGQDFYFDGNGAKLECTVNRRAITGYNTQLGNQKFTILNTYIKQQWNPDTGAGGANNNTPIHVNGLKNPRVFFNLFESSVGVSTNVATVSNINYGTEFAHIMFNHFRDVQKQCVETFGSAHNVVVGNTGDVPLLNSNALRLTGASTPTAVYNKASVYAANTFKGGQGTTESGKYAAGISIQTYVQGASAVANASQGFNWGVNLKGGVDLAGQSRGNYVQHSNVDSDYAVYAESPRSQQVNITAYNYKLGGIKEVTTANSAELLKGVMKYDGILVAGTDTTAAALDILNDGSQFNLLIDLQEAGQDKRNIIRGKNHSGVISVYNSDAGALFLRCDDSNLQITVKDIDDTSNSKVAIRVYGNNNTITVNTRGSVRFEETATGNTLYGRCGRVECLSTTSNNTFYGKSSAIGGFGVNGNTHSNPLDYSETYDPESIHANGTITKTVTMPGVALGQHVVAAFSVYNANIEISAVVSATNTVVVKLKNTSASAIDLASGTLIVKRI